MFLLFAPAFAAEEPVEEIIVYADPFERWDDTRWFVAIEQIVPTGVVMGVDAARSFRTLAWQAAAVLHCSLDPQDRGRRAHPTCQIEDISIRATTTDLWQRQRDRDRVEEILEAIEQELKSEPIAVRAGKRGEMLAAAVPDGSAEAGLTAHHVSRQLMSAFHLDMPPGGAEPGETWSSFDDPMLRLPETLVTRANTLVVHRMDSYAGHQIVQTIGQASTSVIYDGDRGQWGPSPYDKLTRRFSVEAEQALVPEKELPCRTRLDGVAVLDADGGFPTERVWSVQGEQIDYWYAGHLAMLAPDAQVTLGPGGQVAPPGRNRPGVPLWSSVVSSDLPGAP